MKPRNNHRWNRCIIEEDYRLNESHSEQFFSAFDKTFNLSSIILQSSGQSEGKPEIPLNCVSIVPMAERRLCKAMAEGSSPSGYIPVRFVAIRFSLQDKNSERNILLPPYCSLFTKSWQVFNLNPQRVRVCFLASPPIHRLQSCISRTVEQHRYNEMWT